MARLSLFALVVGLLFLTVLEAGDRKQTFELGQDQKIDQDKKPPDQDPDKGKDKDKDQEKEQEKKPVPKPIIVTVELKDWTRIQAEWLGPSGLGFSTLELGALLFKRESVRYLDLEGSIHRLSTHDLESFYGVLETGEFQLKLHATGEVIALPRDRVRRLLFPDRPRIVTIK